MFLVIMIFKFSLLIREHNEVPRSVLFEELINNTQEEVPWS